MKRHESVIILSREHHFGLLFCWKIRQGIKKQVTAERIQPYVKYFWNNHLQRHFEEEETILFTCLQDSLVEQAVLEHKRIRELVKTVTGTESVNPDQLSILADIVDDHIRFEERTLFPHIEKELTEEKLAEIGIRLQELHQEQEKENFVDEFWV